MTKEELVEILNQNRVKLGELRFKLSNGQLKNVRDIRNTRKDIARIITIINSKQKESGN